MTAARPFVYLVETMFQRILSAFSPDTTANKLLRLDWIEALQTPGCALCHMGQRKPDGCRPSGTALAFSSLADATSTDLATLLATATALSGVLPVV